MKQKFFRKNFFPLFFATALLAGCHPASKTTEPARDKAAAEWYSQQDWRNGWTVPPHQTVNQEELYRQYQLNSRWWTEAFHYLQTTDLATLAPGTYVIDSGNVIATVSKLLPKTREEVNWEAHQNFNDLQYMISGKAVMGIVPVNDPKAAVKTPYDGKADVTVYTVTGETDHPATPGKFFIFTPKEIHRPAFRAPEADTVKKIVIKVRVPQGG